MARMTGNRSRDDITPANKASKIIKMVGGARGGTARRLLSHQLAEIAGSGTRNINADPKLDKFFGKKQSSMSGMRPLIVRLTVRKGDPANRLRWSGIRRLLSIALAALLPAAPALAQTVAPVRHELVIRSFRTEGGVVMPEARVVYGIYGTLDAAGDNAVLLPSHYMADLTGYGFLIGPGKALDPTRLFLVTTEMFGNGRSSSPSNTPEPLHGPRFPAVTIRDDVAASRAVLEALHVRHLKAVIGFSMGAEQAFQWAVSYPSFMDRIVATSGTARAWGHGIVRLEGQIAALTTDPAFKAGDYGRAEPDGGIQAFSLVWAGWLYSQEWWRRELWRGDTPGPAGLPGAIDRYRHIFDGKDANDLILQAHTWEAHDIGLTPGFGGDTAAALRSIRVPVLYMPSATDLYFPIGDARYECGFMRACLLYPIPSLWGHPAGAGATPADAAFINDHVARFMAGTLNRPTGAGALQR